KSVVALFSFCGWKIIERIHHLIVDAHFVVKVRSCGSARRSDESDGLPARNRLSHSDIDLRKMAVTSGKPSTVIDVDDVAIAALPSGDSHFAAGGDLNRCAIGRVNV